jgi:hypothetical protein
MPFPASETWTGTDGAAWPAQWDTAIQSAGSTATIQTNRGRLSLGGTLGGYGDSQNAALGDVAVNIDARVDLYISDITEHFAYFLFRDDYAGSSLAVRIQQAANYSDFLSNGSVVLDDTSITIAVSDVIHIHIIALDESVKVWLWRNDEFEPSLPQMEVIDTTHLTNMKVRLLELGGNVAATHYTEWDNLTINVPPGATYRFPGPFEAPWSQ